MGAQQTVDLNPHLDNWEKRSSIYGVSTWVNNVTGDQMEEYPVLLANQQQFDYQMNAFRFRMNSPVLIASKYMKNQRKNQLCSSLYSGSLFLQKIHVRLRKINQIPFPDIIHLYSQAFKGFNLLKEYVGPFGVTEDMIGFNNKGIAKVWMHSDFSKSIAEFSDDVLEPQMLNKIIEIIDVNTYQQSMPENIVTFFRSRKVRTMKEAQLFLKEYTQKYGIFIPQRMECILEKDFQIMHEGRDPNMFTFSGNQIHQQNLFPSSAQQINYVNIPTTNHIQQHHSNIHHDKPQITIVSRPNIHMAQSKSSLIINQPPKSLIHNSQPIRQQIIPHQVIYPNNTLPYPTSIINHKSPSNIHISKSVSQRKAIDNLRNQQSFKSHLNIIPFQPVIQHQQIKRMTIQPAFVNNKIIERGVSPKYLRNNSPRIIQQIKPSIQTHSHQNKNIIRVVSPKRQSSIVNLKQLKNKARSQFSNPLQTIKTLPHHQLNPQPTQIIENVIEHVRNETKNSTQNFEQMKHRYRNQPNNYNKIIQDYTKLSKNGILKNRHLSPSNATQYTHIVKKGDSSNSIPFELSRQIQKSDAFFNNDIVNTSIQTPFKHQIKQFLIKEAEAQFKTIQNSPIKKQYMDENKVQSFSFKNTQSQPEIKTETSRANIAGSQYISSYYIPLTVRSKTESTSVTNHTNHTNTNHNNHSPYDIESINKALQIQKTQIQRKLKQFDQKYDYEFVKTNQTYSPTPPINLNFQLKQFSHYPTVRSRDQYQVTASKAAAYYSSMDPQLLKDLERIRSNLPLNR